MSCTYAESVYTFLEDNQDVFNLTTCLFFRDTNCWKGGYHLLLCRGWACVFQLSQQLWVDERRQTS